MELNELLLAHLGGDWDMRAEADGLAVSEEIGAYRTAALEIVKSLRVMNPGLERSAQLVDTAVLAAGVSDLKVVICLRNHWKWHAR